MIFDAVPYLLFQATALSRQLGYAIGKATDPRFGMIGTYSEDILRQILGW